MHSRRSTCRRALGCTSWTVTPSRRVPRSAASRRRRRRHSTRCAACSASSATAMPRSRRRPSSPSCRACCGVWSHPTSRPSSSTGSTRCPVGPRSSRPTASCRRRSPTWCDMPARRAPSSSSTTSAMPGGHDRRRRRGIRRRATGDGGAMAAWRRGRRCSRRRGPTARRTTTTHGTGILGMRERATLLGGTVDLESSPLGGVGSSRICHGGPPRDPRRARRRPGARARRLPRAARGRTRHPRRRRGLDGRGAPRARTS